MRMLGFWGHRPFLDAYQKAKESAQKAIALDDALSTAHWALAWATWVLDWDLAACEAEILRAIQLNPSDERPHVLYSILLATTSEDCARAVSEVRLALDLDPLSQWVNGNAAWVYLFVKDYERAIEQARKTLELFPGSLQAYWVTWARGNVPGPDTPRRLRLSRKRWRFREMLLRSHTWDRHMPGREILMSRGVC